MSKKYYSGVGSRGTPYEIIVFMERVGRALADSGFTLRSGGADGADAAFERGAGKKCVIYIPWEGFNKIKKDRTHIIATELDNYENAWEMASEIHPNWNRCSAGAQALHSRNCYEVLGHNLNEPSKFLICWSKPTGKDSVSGGTATAWNLAKQHNIPRFNLYREEDYNRVSKLLEK